MVLIRCCPAWFGAGLVCPQPWGVTRYPRQLAVLLEGSLLFGAVLVDLFGADYPGQTPRSEVNLVWWSYRVQHRWYAKVFAHEVDTLGDLWSSANWLERELWEMFGVLVRGHPDLRRLVTDYGFGGYPLRKEFPVGGYLEVRYSEVERRVVSRPAVFTQEFRWFGFATPWLS